MMKKNEKLAKNAIKLSYKLINDLLYFDNDEKDFHLCISNFIKIKIFKLMYNEMNYSEYVYTHERFIKKLYIHNIIIKFYKFIRYYSHYQLN